MLSEFWVGADSFLAYIFKPEALKQVSKAKDGQINKIEIPLIQIVKARLKSKKWALYEIADKVKEPEPGEIDKKTCLILGTLARKKPGQISNLPYR